MLRKRLLFVALTLVMLAAIPTVALAHAITSFTASGAIVRTDPGVSTIDPSTGGLLTTNQVFEGSLSSSWDGLDNADITVNQNSLIGIDPITLGTTGSSPLFGQAWGTFSISEHGGAMSGTYNAGITGTLLLDPFGAHFGCPATQVFGPIDVTGDGVADPVGAYVAVSDNGTWQSASDSATGKLQRVDELGGALTATSTGCLEGQELANLTLNGQIVPAGVNHKNDTNSYSSGSDGDNGHSGGGDGGSYQGSESHGG